MDKWTELRSAYLVAKLGTVTAASEALGVHRATINRHIDSLESSMGGKLFHRHSKGYTTTEAGRDLLKTVGRAEEMFNGLAGRTKETSNNLSGKLVISTLPAFYSLLMPAISEFREEHPEVDLQLDGDYRLVKLEYAEAHVAIRVGPKPNHPDYVVQPFKKVHFALYAHHSYVKRSNFQYDLPLPESSFIGSLEQDDRLPFSTWTRTNIDIKNIALSTKHPEIVLQSLLAGLGVGFLADYRAAMHEELVKVSPSLDQWESPLWIVTHRDLHRTRKVQAFTRLLKGSG